MAPARVQTSVTLFGSPPWGFRLSGGKEFNQPLVITRVTPGSVGAKSGLSSGDVLIAVNGDFVSDMTQDECEAKVKKAAGSLYLVLEKNAASVTVQPTGEVNVQGDRSIYNEDNSVMERISRHNRSAKPFSASPANSSSPSITEKTTTPGKPPGFRPISFRPKESPKSSPVTPPSRGQPDGGSSDQSASSFNSKPKQFVSSYKTGDDLPPPPADFVAQTSPSQREPGKTRVVLGPNKAVGLYSNANAQLSYQAQVGGK